MIRCQKSLFEEGTTQVKIAETLNIDATKLSKLFSVSQLPTVDELLAIASEYHCSIDWLLGNDNDTHEKHLSIYQFCKAIVDLDLSCDLSFDIINKEKTSKEIDLVSGYPDIHEYSLEIPCMYIENAT